MGTDFKRGALVFNVDRDDLEEPDPKYKREHIREVQVEGQAKEHAEEEARKLIRGKHNIEVSSTVCRERGKNFDCEVRIKNEEGYTKSRFQDHFL